MRAAALRLRAAPPPRRAAALASSPAASASARRHRGPASSSSLSRRPATTTTMSASTTTFPTAGPFFLDDFAARQWDDPAYAGTRVPPGALSKEAFARRVADLHSGGGEGDGAAASSPPCPLVDGYAPFCKHVFVPNVLNARVGSLPITDANRPLLRSGYTRRRAEELPVLARWFRERDVAPLPVAKHLDVILYSREQLEREYAAMPDKSGGKGLAALRALPAECAWGIISVKAQDEPFETPMQPITMLRNALGKEEGGSGVSLDREAYEASARYWDAHAAVVATEAPNGE